MTVTKPIFNIKQTCIINVIFILRYTCVHIHLCTCAGKRPTSGVDPQGPSNFWSPVLSSAWSSPRKLDWLAIKPQESSCPGVGSTNNTPPCWDYNCMSLLLALTWILGTQLKPSAHVSISLTEFASVSVSGIMETKCESWRQTNGVED